MTCIHALENHIIVSSCRYVAQAINFISLEDDDPHYNVPLHHSVIQRDIRNPIHLQNIGKQSLQLGRWRRPINSYLVDQMISLIGLSVN